MHVALVWAQQQQVELTWNTGLRWLVWLVLGFFGLFPGLVAYLVWAERKVAARFQDRIGPNRVGPLGLLQPIADAIKLLGKENIVPRGADRLAHILAPVLVIVSAFLMLAVVPFGIGLAPVNLPSGLVYLVAVSSLAPLGIFLAGWSSRNKYSLLGAMRGVAQLVSYEVPQVLATIPVVLWAGSLSLNTIFDRQMEHGWFVFSPPGLLGLGILLIASIAEVNRAPFDLPEAESEIIAGYHTEYSGTRFGLFFLGEYLSLFGVCSIATVLYLGGGALVPWSNFPAGLLADSHSTYLPAGHGYAKFALVNLVFVGAFFAKVACLVFVMFWVRATLPRMRVDRLMNFAWKHLVPLAIANLVIAGVWYELVLRPGRIIRDPWWGWEMNRLAGWLVTGLLVLCVVWLVIGLNRLAERQSVVSTARSEAS